VQDTVVTSSTLTSESNRLPKYLDKLTFNNQVHGNQPTTTKSLRQQVKQGFCNILWIIWQVLC